MVVEKHEKGFLQGLKPVGIAGIMPGLKPRPPEKKDFPRSR